MTDNSHITVSGVQLKSIVNRIERLDEEIKGLNGDKKEVYGEARANSFNVKALKKIVAERRINSNDREEQNAIFDLYMDALSGSETTASLARTHVR